MGARNPYQLSPAFLRMKSRSPSEVVEARKHMSGAGRRSRRPIGTTPPEQAASARVATYVPPSEGGHLAELTRGRMLRIGVGAAVVLSALLWAALVLASG